VIFVRCPNCDRKSIPVLIYPAERQTWEYPGCPAEAEVQDDCLECGCTLTNEEDAAARREAFEIAAEMDEPPEPDPYDEEHDR